MTNKDLNLNFNSPLAAALIFNLFIEIIQLQNKYEVN